MARCTVSELLLRIYWFNFLVSTGGASFNAVTGSELLNSGSRNLASRN